MDIIEKKWVFIDNAKWGRLFVAAGDKKGSDHIVETTDTFSDKHKFQWRFYAFGKMYLVENREYGFMFAASGDRKGQDHIVECDPIVRSLEQAKKKADNNPKWCWALKNAGLNVQIINQAYGLVFAADGDKKGNDHIVEARPEASETEAQWCWRVRQVEQFDGKNWMGRLPEKARQGAIYSVTMPGSHDSGTKSLSIPLGLAMTQSTTIPEQLNMGVRFLDIRLKVDGNKLSVCHGVLGSNYHFHQVLSECQSFLKQNPSECILMSVKCDHNDSAAFAKNFESRYSEYFATDNKLTSLESASGKILLMRRFSMPAQGIQLSIPNNTSGSDNIGTDGNRIYVQDEYERDLQQAYIKKRVVEGFLDRTDEDGLYVNFISATGTYYGIPRPKDMADKMNRWLSTVLAERNTPSGVLVCDYVVPSIVDSIIAVNFRCDN